MFELYTPKQTTIGDTFISIGHLSQTVKKETANKTLPNSVESTCVRPSEPPTARWTGAGLQKQPATPESFTPEPTGQQLQEKVCTTGV